MGTETLTVFTSITNVSIKWDNNNKTILTISGSLNDSYINKGLSATCFKTSDGYYGILVTVEVTTSAPTTPVIVNVPITNPSKLPSGTNYTFVEFQWSSSKKPNPRVAVKDCNPF
jgi:hypothetical protein